MNAPLPTTTWVLWLKRAAVLVVLLLVATVLWFVRDRLALDQLAEQEQQLRDFTTEQLLLSALIAWGIYVAVAASSLPLSTVLTVTYGWLFGFWEGLLLVNLGATAGATIAMLMSRYLIGEYVQARWGDRLHKFNLAVDRNGWLVLLSLRLNPAVPFFLLNLAMGLTKLPTRTFWWATQLGMLPAAAVYVYAGSNVASLRTIEERGLRSLFTPQLFFALVAISLFPIFMSWIVRRVRPVPVQ